MTSIFAAVDAQGETRFVGDVPSGQACGCFCPSCSSPLEAKKGSVRIWHFAHVAMQERPECRAGALNLLRRLALQKLASSPSIRIPAQSVTISDTRPALPARQRVHDRCAGLCAVARPVFGWCTCSPEAKTHPILELGTGPAAACLVFLYRPAGEGAWVVYQPDAGLAYITRQQCSGCCPCLLPLGLTLSVPKESLGAVAAKRADHRYAHRFRSFFIDITEPSARGSDPNRLICIVEVHPLAPLYQMG